MVFYALHEVFAVTYGSLFVLYTFIHIIFRLNVSTQPRIAKPNSLNLSCLSILYTLLLT